MTVYIDKKYISLLAPKLNMFRPRGEFLWQFRCPICHDSQKNEYKSRGYIYKKGTNFSFLCHNCGASMRLSDFIRYMDPQLYSEYQLETFREKTSTTNRAKDVEFPKEFLKQPVFAKSTKLKETILTPLSDLPENFFARKFMSDRKVPLKGLYYTSDFSSYIKEQFPECDKELYEEPRIVIPYFDKEGNLLGVQGRSIGPSKIKYITIKSNDDAIKIFGLDKLDTTRRIYVVEGPIDSLFLENAVATMDASLYHAASLLGLDLDYVFVYDNEPRNRQIVSNMRKTVALNRKICIWPSDIKEKDINDMVLKGRSPAEIQHIIDRNTFDGLSATMKLNQWEKTE